jgi:oligoribonuclease
MAQEGERLIWIDMEMSGLNPATERILELAVVVTDSNLETVAEAPILVVHQPQTLLDAMDSWNKATHARSGLVQRVQQSDLNEALAQARMLEFLRPLVGSGQSPMCGNSVHQDRRFLALYMPELEAHFHYRNLDVSTLKELAKRWRPDVYNGFKKDGKHEALADVYESINELRYYREHFLKV